MSFPLCVFLDSLDQGRLPLDHPFYCLVNETRQHIIESPLVLGYMAKVTLQNEPRHDEVAEKRRIQEIIQYLQTNHLTVSGSDSPSMDLTLVDTRAYSGCGKDRKSRKLARKHVYIHKSLVDNWIEVRTETYGVTVLHPYPPNLGYYYLLTFLIKLCLLRGSIVAVKTAFMSEGFIGKQLQVDSPGFAHGSSCSFERFLWEWNFGWLLFRCRGGVFRYDFKHLMGIVFKSNLSHIKITYSRASENEHSLLRLLAGDWTSFSPEKDFPYTLFHPERKLIQMWDSPPGEAPKPRTVEMMQWSDEGNRETCCIV